MTNIRAQIDDHACSVRVVRTPLCSLTHKQSRDAPAFCACGLNFYCFFSQGCIVKRCIWFPICNYSPFFFTVSFQSALRKDWHGPSHPHGDNTRASFCNPPLPLQAVLHPVAWVTFKKVPPCLKHSSGFPCTRRKSEHSTLTYRALTEFLWHDHLKTWRRTVVGFLPRTITKYKGLFFSQSMDGFMEWHLFSWRVYCYTGQAEGSARHRK